MIAIPRLKNGLREFPTYEIFCQEYNLNMLGTVDT